MILGASDELRGGLGPSTPTETLRAACAIAEVVDAIEEALREAPSADVKALFVELAGAVHAVAPVLAAGDGRWVGESIAGFGRVEEDVGHPPDLGGGHGAENATGVLLLATSRKQVRSGESG